MFRVTTGGNYSRVLSNIMLAQQRQMDAGDKLSTQQNGSNLKDYARNAEMLTAMRSVTSKPASLRMVCSLLMISRA